MIGCMEFVVSRDPRLPIHYLFPSRSRKTQPDPVIGRATSYHFWARNALFHGLGSLGLNPGDTVLVPAFHCSTVVEPIRHYGCEVIFYNVHRDGVVDFEDLARKVDSQVKAVVAIHYFGVLQPLQKIREFCHHHHLFFIEDCAHLFMGESREGPIGSVGDISIFSWRKFLPIYDGGMLVCNHAQYQRAVPWQGLSGWFQVKIVKNLLEKCLSDRATPRLSIGPNQRTEFPVQGAVSHDGVGEPFHVNTHVPEFDASQLNWPMSRWSRYITEHIDVSKIMRKRQEHSSILSQALGELPGIRPWSKAGEHRVCAWAFPIVVEHRTDLHVELRKRGIQAFSWSGVIHPTLDLAAFSDAKFLYEHVVLLPNHQSLTQSELHFMIDTVKGVL
ncbi:MAG: hypothetical protein NPIRA02_14980 [Nitrospirales bacterium]|nr:MAG: hypothetical protein NPIRA02_14980 [Nitrospirales bacterium]